MADDLEVNDPVFVSRESRQLEGVVCFLGTVSFAEGDDWVGIRLVGTSQGLGKNDGSVQSIQYFECPQNCGIFVKKSAVTKRTLTRLEELRLRRELAQSGTPTTTTSTTSSTESLPLAGGPPETPTRLPTAGSGTNPARTPRTPATATTPSLATPSTASSTTTRIKTPLTTAASSSATRLEEIRKRREALQGKSSTTIPSRNTSITSPLDSSATDKNDSGGDDHVQQQLQQAQSQLKAQEIKVEQLEQQLSLEQKKSKEQAEQLTLAAALALQQAQEIKVATTESSVTATPVQSTAPSSDNNMDLESLPQEMQDQHLLKDQLLSTLQQELEQQKTRYQEQGVQLLQSQTQAQSLQNQLTDLADQAEMRGASDASHYKERARLQAEVASLNRKSEQLELEKQELENSVEDLALDKEQLQEEKEGLEDRFEELKLDAETAQMEVDELRLELEATNYSRAAIDVDMAETTTQASDGQDNNAVASSSNAEDQARALSVQNARLREALIRLREQSSVNQMDLSRQLRTVEKELEESKALATEVESARELKKDLEEQISDLKDMVEQGSAYEVMVEDLSDRVLSLEEELMASQAMIREMEEAADITAEMEEVQSEELKELSRDLEDRESIIRNLEEAIKM
jgi:dynactin 1